jgi:hypothetical protein
MKKSLTSTYTDQSSESETTATSLFRPFELGLETPKTPRTPRERYGGSGRRTASTDHKPLSKWQEDYFLNYFWQSYHCIYPILDETEFQAHHNSLWTVPWESRKPSPLVDIVLAICMQYTTALIPPDSSGTVVSAEERGKDASTAGRSYYRRCQSLLQDDLEGPNIMTLQCRVFSVIYLSNAGSINASYAMLALACRTGVIMGLHREPLNDLEEREKNKQRRLWWTVYILELKAVLELGRHMAINMSQVTVRLPTEEYQTEAIAFPGQNTSPQIQSSFVANLQWVKLILAWRSVYVTFYHKCADLLGPSHHKSLHENALALENCANFLCTKMAYLEIWLRGLPESLKARRRDFGEPFSTDGKALDFRPVLPFIQQRQQLFLELHYHTIVGNLLRPFICFSPYSEVTNPTTGANAMSCLEHAITVTDIIHQALIETDLLLGWLETFHWLCTAFLSLIGYTVAYPDGDGTLKARNSIRKAISTFDILSGSLSTASTYARIARDLSAKADILVNRLGAECTALSTPTEIVDPIIQGAEVTELYDFQEFGHFNVPFNDAVGPASSNFVLEELYQLDHAAAMDWVSVNGDENSDMWTLGTNLGLSSFLN